MGDPQFKRKFYLQLDLILAGKRSMNQAAKILECDPKTIRKYVRLSQGLPVKTIQKSETAWEHAEQERLKELYNKQEALNQGLNRRRSRWVIN